MEKNCRIQIWFGKCISDCKIYSYLYFHVPAQSVSFTRFKLSTWSICPLIFHCQKAWTTRVETVGRHFPLLFWCKFCKVKKNMYIILHENWSFQFQTLFFEYLALRFMSKIKPFHLVWRFSYMDVMTKVRYFLTNES